MLLLLGYAALGLGSIFLTLFRSWPRSLAAFTLQSLGVSAVALQIAPLPVAFVKGLVGLIVVSITALTLFRERRHLPFDETGVIASLFRLSLLLFLFSSIVALLPEMQALFQNPPVGIILPACFLLGNGFINLGLSEHPIRVGLSLVSILQGFELAYLWMEQSLLVIGLLAVVDLAIVLALIILFSGSLSGTREEVGA